MRRSRKPLCALRRTEGSNPSLSAFCRYFVVSKSAYRCSRDGRRAPLLGLEHGLHECLHVLAGSVVQIVRGSEEQARGPQGANPAPDFRLHLFGCPLIPEPGVTCRPPERGPAPRSLVRSGLRSPRERGGIRGGLSLIHISEPTRRTPSSYAVFCLQKKK